MWKGVFQFDKWGAGEHNKCKKWFVILTQKNISAIKDYFWRKLNKFWMIWVIGNIDKIVNFLQIW